MGGDLTLKSIPSVGGLIEYLCSGVGTFAFFRQRDWEQVSAWLHSTFDLFWQRCGVWSKVFYHNIVCLHCCFLHSHDDVEHMSCCLIKEIG